MTSKKKNGGAAVPIVNAAARVLAVLESLSRKRSVGLEELSGEMGLAKPTVYRFLQTLQELGYARRDESDRWAMTLKAFNVGSRALDHLDLHAAARPVAEGLAEELGETVHMGVLEGDSAVYVLKIESKYTIRMFSRVGRRIPLYCSAIGKVLLAYSGPAERKAALEGLRLVAFTPKTIVTRKRPRGRARAVQGSGLRPRRRGARGGDRLPGSAYLRPRRRDRRRPLGLLAPFPLRSRDGGRKGRLSRRRGGQGVGSPRLRGLTDHLVRPVP